MTRARRALFAAAIALAILPGCAQEALEANRRQVEANQAQIEQLQKQIVALTQQQNYPVPAPAAGPRGGCDKAVMGAATRRGGAAFAAGNLKRARGYYQDAVAACPGAAKAELNLGRVYEAMGDRTSATAHYRTAADSKDSDAAAVRDARAALSRLEVSY